MLQDFLRWIDPSRQQNVEYLRRHLEESLDRDLVGHQDSKIIRTYIGDCFSTIIPGVKLESLFVELETSGTWRLKTHTVKIENEAVSAVMAEYTVDGLFSQDEVDVVFDNDGLHVETTPAS